jgi:hypothetical protein
VPVGAEVSQTVVVGGSVLVEMSVMVEVAAVVMGVIELSIGYVVWLEDVVEVTVENGVTVTLAEDSVSVASLAEMIVLVAVLVLLSSSSQSQCSVVVEDVTDVAVASAVLLLVLDSSSVHGSLV